MLAQHERRIAPLRAVSKPPSTSPAPQIPGPDSVKAALTPKRR